MPYMVSEGTVPHTSNCLDYASIASLFVKKGKNIRKFMRNTFNQEDIGRAKRTK